jgi:hypothetical protein
MNEYSVARALGDLCMAKPIATKLAIQINFARIGFSFAPQAE